MATQQPRTKTEQIIEALRLRIDSDDYPLGSRIPSTARLEEEFGASKTAVTAAVKELKQEGLLEGQPGKGVYVAATSESVRRTKTDLDELADGLRMAREEIEQLKARPATEDNLRSEIDTLRNMVVNLYSYVMELYSRIGARQPEGLKGLSQDFDRDDQRNIS